MLPLFKRNNAGTIGIAVKVRRPDEKAEGGEITEENEDKDAPIIACAKDLIIAVHAHDVEATAEAIKSAFEILDSEPHVEGPHIGEE